MLNKRNILNKLWLKYTDVIGYQNYKWYQLYQTQIQLGNSERLNSLDKIMQLSINNGKLNISHSGNAGDIIYALPTIKKIVELTKVDVHLFLRLNMPLNLPKGVSHPLGNVMLNQNIADLLLPLVRLQPYLASCNVYNNEHIDLDLDYFREGLIPLDKGNIARWCGYITGINPNLYTPWLTVEPDNTYADIIILARSHRYRNVVISHSFLSRYPNLKFVGVAAEYEDMKTQIPQLEWLQVEDFLHLARVIAGCKFFIGNPSFPFSIAEGLKVPRMLEASFHMTNVVPEGDYAYDFMFQPHFESLVEQLYQS